MMDVDKSCEFCDHCLYIGEGDFWCDEKCEIIASEFGISEAQVCEKYEEGE